MQTIQFIDQDDNKEFLLEDNGQTSIIREFEGFEYPDVRSAIEDVAGKQSAVHVTSKFGRRRLSVTGDIVGSDVFGTRRELFSVMRQTGQMKLVKILTYDNLALQFEADIVKVVAPYNHKVQSFLIELVAADWRLYSQTLHEEISSSASQVIENAGNERTEAVFRIDGPFTEVELTNNSNSESFALEIDGYGVEEGHYIEVDCFNRTVKLDGVTPIYNAFSGEFFSLLPGENTLTFNVTGGSGSTGLRTKWRDAYNGI